MNLCQGILSAVLLSFAAFGAGRALLCKLLPDAENIAAYALGIIFFAWMPLFMPPYAVVCMLFPAAAAGIWFFAPSIKDQRGSAVIFLMIVLFFAGSALLPPSVWDEQVYQVALLKEYFHSASTAVRMDNPYSAYPSLAQMWVFPGFVLGGMNVPVLSLLLLNGVMACRFYAFAKRYGKLSAAVVLAAFLLSPLLWNIIKAFYVESFIVLFGFVGALIICIRRENDDVRKLLFLCGCMGGGAAAVKLTGFAVSAALAVVILCDGRLRKQIHCFVLGAAVAALPFFLRVWICCGDPFYPFVIIFSNSRESVHLVGEFHRVLGGNYGMGALAGIFLNWLTCSFAGDMYDGIILGLQFPMLLCAAVLGFNWMSGEKRKKFLTGAAALLTMWIFWNFSSQQSRFLAPVFYLSGFLALYALAAMQTMRRQLMLLLIAVSSLSAIYLDYSHAGHFAIAWKTFPEAAKNPAHFASWRAKEPEYYEVCRQLEELKGSRIALLWERRTLYFPAGVRIIMPGFQEKLTPVPENADKVYEVLAGYDFLMVRPPTADVDTGIEFVQDALRLNDMIMELVRRGKLEVFRYTSDGRVSILRIVPEDGDGAETPASSSSKSL